MAPPDFTPLMILFLFLSFIHLLIFFAGLNRLLSNNSYEAAFPLHEVIWLLETLHSFISTTCFEVIIVCSHLPYMRPVVTPLL